jgi:putative transposase
MEKEEFTIKEVCKTLGISRSGYYSHLIKQEGQRRQADGDLSGRIYSAFCQSRRTYGTRRLRMALAREGLFCSRRRISRLMRTNGLRALRKGRFRPRTTDSRHNHPIAPNHLMLRADSSLLAPPEQTWVADITYLPTAEGWHYLAAEMNLGSRRIVGWKTGPTLESTLVESALSRALFSQSPPKIHHSDRGSQYAAGSFRSLLKSHGVIPSMSRRANCYDNAAMESFWATLKTECFHTGIPATRADADRILFDYIETFYNPCRLHSALGYRSPFEFEKSLKPSAPKNLLTISQN